MSGRRTPVARRGALRTAAGAVLAGASVVSCAPDGTTRPPARTARNGEDVPGTPGATPGSPGPQSAGKAHGAVRPAAAPRRFPGQPVEIEHGPRNRPRVALTFHGQGDPTLARAVLAAAERAGARLTVLAVGSWLDQNPGMARRILDGGHDLGNHTQSHLDINTMDETRAYEEIDGCARRLRHHRLDRHLVQALARPARHPARPGPRTPGRIPARALLRRGLPRLHLTRGRGRHPQGRRMNSATAPW